jgi:hypothetical protein
LGVTLVVLGLVATARADLAIHNTDHNLYWGDGPVVPYEVTVTNLDFIGPVSSVVVTEYVPVNTTFEPAQSTSGWTCTGSGDDTTCTFALGDLGPGEVRTLMFAVRVNAGTDPKWDLYTDARVTGAVTAVISRAETGLDLTDDDCTIFDAAFECLGLGGTVPFAVTRGSDSTVTTTTMPLSGVDCCALTAYCILQPGSCLDACFNMYDVLSPKTPTFPRGVPADLDLFVFYRMRDLFFRKHEGGRKGIALYYQHTGEITRVIASDANVRDLGKAALLAWQPSLQMLDEGQPATVSSGQIQALAAFLDALRPLAGKPLAGAIDRGRARLQVETWEGITMDDALARLDQLVCTREATGASVVCRIDDIGEVFEGAPAGPLTDKLVASLAKARTTAVAADQLAAGRQRRAGFKKTGKLLGKLAKRVKSRKGQKAFPDAAFRAKITDPIGLLRADLKQIR